MEEVQYLKYTNVDFQTRRSCFEGPCKNGPDKPAVIGLKEDFWLESHFPTNTPIFFGTCPYDSATDVSGVIAVITKEEYDEAFSKEKEDRFEKKKSELRAEVSKVFDSKEAENKKSLGNFEDFLISVIAAKDFLAVGNKEALVGIKDSDMEKWAKDVSSAFNEYCVFVRQNRSDKEAKIKAINAAKTEKTLAKIIEGE